MDLPVESISTRLHWLIILFVQSVLIHGNDLESSDTSICGGFVVSDCPLEFAKIEVHLLDKHGNLKYQAPCSPSNGNYEVPVFGKKGEFVLAISAPEGLSFEPTRIPIKIDGVSDPCSKQNNINFRFLGYSVRGKVQSKNTREGPAGVHVKVFDKANKEIYSTETFTGGSFTVPHLLPGTYEIAVSHPEFGVEKAKISVTVTDAVVTLPDNSLVISGYPASGVVQSNSEPIEDVIFVLYSKEVEALDVSGCEKSLKNELQRQHPIYGNQLCESKSNLQGKFMFGSLVPGSYVIVPTYKGGNTNYNIVPTHYDFSMVHEPVQINTPFEVKGFTASGSVRSGSVGIPSANIYINGTLVTKTDKSGAFRLERTITGWYQVDVKKDYYEFPSAYVKITPMEPQIAPIFARSINICGEIKTLRPVSRVLTFEAVDVKTGISRDTVIRDNKFCTFLESGEYRLSIFDAPSDKYQHLIFSPSEKIIKLENFPITDLLFTQLLGSISGTVRCIGTCAADLRVSILTNGGQIYADVKDSGGVGSFKFENIDLGTHILQLIEPSDRSCWDLIKKSVELTTKKPTVAIGFLQTGFLMEIWSSHDAEISYGTPGNKTRKQEKVKSGFTELCLPDAGDYAIQPTGCHKFEQEVYQYSTTLQTRLSLQAVAHLTNISVNTDDVSAPFKLRIRKSSDGSSSILTPSGQPKPISMGTFQYSFIEYFPLNEELTIIPFSDILIFKPSQFDVHVSDLCANNVAILEAFKGVMIRGTVIPPVPDVDVVLTTESEVLRGKTDQQGAYSLGPVVRSVIKSIIAEKRGYEIEAIPDSANFKATKLSEIKVQTLDSTGLPVQNVLVSLSNSGGYRTSSFTDQTGIVSFVNVAPGDYIVRPMVKEFRFDPASKSINLAQGKTSEVHWAGIRIAYSAVGEIKTIGGEPESGITVEAVSREPCPQMQEESKTGSNGNFRISGLKAGCTYIVRVKEAELAEMDIRWTAPNNRSISMGAEDFHGVNFIAFRGYNEVEFTGYIDTAKEFLPTLKACLFRSDRMSEPIQCISFAINPMFSFDRVPLDQRSYVIRLDSSLSRKEYVFSTIDLSVKANSTFQHYNIPFKAARKISEPEITPGTMWIVPLVVIASVIYMYRESISPFVLTIIERFRNASKLSPKRERKRVPATSSAANSVGESTDDYPMTGPTTKKKPKSGK